MAWIDCLLIGSSDNGPDATPFLPISIEEAKDVYGWYSYQWTNLHTQQASAVIDGFVWGNEVSAFKKVGIRLYPESLYALTVNSPASSISFGSVGTSGTYLIKYVKEPQEDSLLLSFLTAVQQGSPLPTLYRVSGNKANVRIGDIYLEARNSGTKFNGITITISASILHIHYKNHNYSSETIDYDLNVHISKLADNINTDFYRNKHPLKCTFNPVNSYSLPNGTYSTTGGTVGSVTADNIEDILAGLDLEQIGCILLCGGIPSGVVSLVDQYLIDNNIGGCSVIASMPIYQMDWTKDTFKNYLTNIPTDSDNIFLVPGWARTSVIYGHPKWVPLSSIFSGLWNTYTTAPTNKPTTIEDIYPYWNQQDLADLSEKYVVFNKFIMSGIAPYRSTPTSGLNPLISKVKTDIAKRISTAFEGFIGEPSLRLEEAKRIADIALADLDNVKEIQYSLELSTFTLTIIIYLIVYGEVNYIEFNLTSNRPQNA